MTMLPPGSKLCAATTCPRCESCARHQEALTADKWARVFATLCAPADSYFPHFVKDGK